MIDLAILKFTHVQKCTVAYPHGKPLGLSKLKLSLASVCTVLLLTGCNSTQEQTSYESIGPVKLNQYSSPQKPYGQERAETPKSTTPPLLEKVDKSEDSAQNQHINAKPNPNSAMFTPYKGSKARIYGTYSAGCIDGAVRISDKDQSFQVQRWGKDRNYAHPMMADYIFDLVKRAKLAGLPPLMFGC